MPKADVAVVLAHRGLAYRASPLERALPAASQRPRAAAARTASLWSGRFGRGRPCQLAAAGEGRMIASGIQRFMAGRVKALICTVHSDRVPMTAKAAVVADVLMVAVVKAGQLG